MSDSLKNVIAKNWNIHNLIKSKSWLIACVSSNTYNRFIQMSKIKNKSWCQNKCFIFNKN